MYIYMYIHIYIQKYTYSWLNCSHHSQTRKPELRWFVGNSLILMLQLTFEGNVIWCHLLRSESQQLKIPNQPDLYQSCDSYDANRFEARKGWEGTLLRITIYRVHSLTRIEPANGQLFVWVVGLKFGWYPRSNPRQEGSRHFRPRTRTSVH